MEYQVSFATTKSPAEAVAAVEAALQERKFSVLWHLNVNQKLAEKGLELGPEVHILEVCSAPRAKQAIETNPDVAFFLPCKIVVHSAGGQTRIGLTKPSILMNLLNDARFNDLAEEVESIMLEAVKVASA